MYVFGRNDLTPQIDAEYMRALVAEGRSNSALRFASVDTILAILAKIGLLWHDGGPYFDRAVAALSREAGLLEGAIRATLRLIPSLFAPANVRRRLTSEFGNPAILDGFVSRDGFEGKVRAFPLGVVFHVTAGNVFVGCIDSLLMGFLTKNVSVLKLSSSNTAFPLLFAESVLEADESGILASSFAMLHFRSNSALVTEAKRQCDAIIAWGGEDAIRAYKDGLPPGCKFLEYGPKISCQVIHRRALEELGEEEVASRIAADICVWDQAACASPQNLFVEEGTDVEVLMDRIGEAIDRYPIRRRPLDPDEQTEILKERFRAKLSALCEGGAYRDGQEFLLHLDPHEGIRPSALNRTLIIKRFANRDDLIRQLSSARSYLQSCSYLVCAEEKAPLLAALASAGIKRFAPLGEVMDGMPGAPHDGRFGLTELVHFVGDEAAPDLVAFLNEAIREVPYYRDAAAGNAVRSIEEMPLLSGADLARDSLSSSRRFVREDCSDGYVFSSSGTSGNPKYVFYSHDEFRAVARMLAKGFAAQGLAAGDVVANLFVAGNLWSSFMAVDAALRHLRAVTLPIGGLADPRDIVSYLTEFRPRAVVGLPGLLSELARRSAELGAKVSVPMLFYAGEHLSQRARDLLANAWGVKQFCSAGYASVDAGPIGYQCSYCRGGEHHLHAAQVHMEVVQGEAVITSTVRKQMPIIRYRTGDRVELGPPGRCACGSEDPKFLLLGRYDDQLNVWGCRVFVTDIERAISQLGLGAPRVQVVLEHQGEGSSSCEKITVKIESFRSGAERSSTVDALKESIYELSVDVKRTHDLAWVRERLLVRFVDPGALDRNPRTGKIRPVIDLRGAET